MSTRQSSFPVAYLQIREDLPLRPANRSLDVSFLPPRCPIGVPRPDTEEYPEALVGRRLLSPATLQDLLDCKCRVVESRHLRHATSVLVHALHGIEEALLTLSRVGEEESSRRVRENRADEVNQGRQLAHLHHVLAEVELHLARREVLDRARRSRELQVLPDVHADRGLGALEARLLQLPPYPPRRPAHLAPLLLGPVLAPEKLLNLLRHGAHDRPWQRHCALVAIEDLLGPQQRLGDGLRAQTQLRLDLLVSLALLES